MTPIQFLSDRTMLFFPFSCVHNKMFQMLDQYVLSIHYFHPFCHS